MCCPCGSGVRQTPIYDLPEVRSRTRTARSVWIGRWRRTNRVRWHGPDSPFVPLPSWPRGEPAQPFNPGGGPDPGLPKLMVSIIDRWFRGVEPGASAATLSVSQKTHGGPSTQVRRQVDLGIGSATAVGPYGRAGCGMRGYSSCFIHLWMTDRGYPSP